MGSYSKLQRGVFVAGDIAIMSLKAFLLDVAKEQMRDEAFVEVVLKLLQCEPFDITEVEHLAPVDVADMAAAASEQRISAGKKGLMLAAVRIYQEKNGCATKDAAASAQLASSESCLQAALIKALGPLKPKAVEVDLAGSMAKAGLDKFFVPDQWPDSGAVRELAAQMKGKHGPKKFIAVDLRK